MEIIITGGSGFVGRNLIKHFCEKKVDVLSLSLRDKNWKSKIDGKSNAIIHLAGKAHDTKNVSDKDEYFKINSELTKQLFDLFLVSEINDFIYFSSVKASADKVEGVLDENHESNPSTPYGLSKLQAEEYLLSKNLPSYKRVIILRPCMIHGEGNKGNLNLLYKVVSTGIPYPLGSFNNERSFLGIDNLNYIIESILSKKEMPSGIYNVADDDFVSTNKLISLIANVGNKKVKIWNIPQKLILMVAKLGDALKLPLNSERLQKLTENYRVSNDKIKKALEIKKLPFTAESALIKTIKNFSK